MSGWPITGSVSTTLACTTSTGNVACGGTGAILRVYNAGSVIAYVSVGTSNAVTASAAAGTSSLLCPPGWTEYTVRDDFTYIAGITASSTATLWFQRGVSAP